MIPVTDREIEFCAEDGEYGGPACPFCSAAPGGKHRDDCAWGKSTWARERAVEGILTTYGVARIAKQRDEALAEAELTHQRTLKMQEHRDELIAMLAECYRLTGADPDGNEDWRLAPDAVGEVRRLRSEYDEACRELAAFGWRPVAEAPSGKAILLWAIGRDGNRKVGVGQRRPDGTWTWPPWRTPTHFIPLKALGVPPGVKP